MTQTAQGYYVPAPSHWPITAALGMFLTLGGLAVYLDGHSSLFMYGGVVVLLIMFYGWFSKVIGENEAGTLDDDQVDRSFRQGMAWFIVSEVAFFAAFFGALYYAREFVIPWLGGSGHGATTHAVLWPEFVATWPLIAIPDPAATFGAVKHAAANQAMGAWGLPALNTLILLSSGVTITWAHWGLQKDNRKQLVIGLFLTVALGTLFLALQVTEYVHAYSDLNLKLSSGIYGSTFFMLTGFHGAHVTIGTIMLLAILVRSSKGHFTNRRHFAFEAAAWYWHFVDIVWLLLFVFVYVL